MKPAFKPGQQVHHVRHAYPKVGGEDFGVVVKTETPTVQGHQIETVHVAWDRNGTPLVHLPEELRLA